MARIRLAELDELEPDVAGLITMMEELSGDSTALRALAHRPELLKSFVGFYGPLQTEGMLSRKEVELVRLSIAQINQCANCLSARYRDSFDEGLTEELVAALPGAEDSDLFTEREKAAIAYAQAMATNHYAVGDDHFRRLHEHFTEEELVELVMDVAQFIGIGRMLAVLDATNEVCSIENRASAAT